MRKYVRLPEEVWTDILRARQQGIPWGEISRSLPVESKPSASSLASAFKGRASFDEGGYPISIRPRKKARIPERVPLDPVIVAEQRAERLRQTALRYYEAFLGFGTYQRAGESLGVSRQRVQQVLRRAEEQGWVPPLDLLPSRIDRKIQACGGRSVILSLIYKHQGSVAAVSREAGISCADIRLEFAEAISSARVPTGERLWRRYSAHAERLGYYPSSTWVIKNDASLFNAVVKHCGWRTFYAKHGIAPKRSDYFMRGEKRQPARDAIISV